MCRSLVSWSQMLSSCAVSSRRVLLSLTSTPRSRRLAGRRSASETRKSTLLTWTHASRLLSLRNNLGPPPPAVSYYDVQLEVIRESCCAADFNAGDCAGFQRCSWWCRLVTSGGNEILSPWVSMASPAFNSDATVSFHPTSSRPLPTYTRFKLLPNPQTPCRALLLPLQLLLCATTALRPTTR